MKSELQNPQAFFEELGYLHDACIEALRWSPKLGEIEFDIDDLNSNFLGLPEYKGCQPTKIVMCGVTKIDFAMNWSSEDSLNIYELIVSPSDEGLDVEVNCWPGGKIAIACISLCLSEIEGSS